MKYWKRWLGIALIMLALVLAAPGALAASKITLKSGAAAPSNVYTGHSYSLKVAGVQTKFYSNNKKVATIIMTTGTFKPHSPGTVTITAKNKKSGKVVATKKFTVLQRATSIAATPHELELAVGQTYTLTAAKTPATSTDTVEFFSSDKKVATVGKTSGKVTATGVGTATITVYSKALESTPKTSKNNKTATVEVTVTALVDRMTAVENKNNVKFTVKFGELTTDEDMKTVNVTMGEENIGVKNVTINSKKHKATYTLDRKLQESETYIFTYKDDVIYVKHQYIRCKTLTIDPASLKLAVGQTAELKPTMTPSDTTDFIRYKSADEKIATVNKDGLVTAKKPGETEILVYATKKATTKLTNKDNVVTKVPVTVEEQDAISGAEQIGKKKVRLTFLRDTKDIDKSAIEIKGLESTAKAKVAFKNVVKAASGKKYTWDLTLDEELIDGKRYAVVYTNPKGEVSQAEFTAMDLVVAGYEILPEYVVEGIPTRVSAWALNSAGERLYGQEGGLQVTLIDRKAGVTFENDHLTIDKAGKTADVFAGIEGGGEEFATITCIASGDEEGRLLCAGLFPDHKLGDGKQHVPGDCRVKDHFKCDGGNHDQAQCQIAGHFNCDDLDHEPAECHIAGHWECSGEHGICPICFYRLCNGSPHGEGKCFPPPPPQQTTDYTITRGERYDFANQNTLLPLYGSDDQQFKMGTGWYLYIDCDEAVELKGEDYEIKASENLHLVEYGHDGRIIMAQIIGRKTGEASIYVEYKSEGSPFIDKSATLSVNVVMPTKMSFDPSTMSYSKAEFSTAAATKSASAPKADVLMAKIYSGNAVLNDCNLNHRDNGTYVTFVCTNPKGDTTDWKEYFSVSDNGDLEFRHSEEIEPGTYQIKVKATFCGVDVETDNNKPITLVVTP